MSFLIFSLNLWLVFSFSWHCLWKSRTLKLVLNFKSWHFKNVWWRRRWLTNSPPSAEGIGNHPLISRVPPARVSVIFYCSVLLHLWTKRYNLVHRIYMHIIRPGKAWIQRGQTYKDSEASEKNGMKLIKLTKIATLFIKLPGILQGVYCSMAWLLPYVVPWISPQMVQGVVSHVSILSCLISSPKYLMWFSDV